MIEIHIICARCKKNHIEKCESGEDGLYFLRGEKIDEYLCPQCLAEYKTLKARLREDMHTRLEEFLNAIPNK